MSTPSPLFNRAREFARRPGVRRVATPMAAAYFSLRNRRRDAYAKWRAGTTYEVAHWDDQWLEAARADGLLDPQRPLDDAFVLEAVLSRPADQDPVTLLDVGAGPLTPLGKTVPDRELSITACDALAKEYDAILNQAGVTPPVRTVFAEGEHLISVFGPDSFDLVHCGNALDHHRDPIAALEQMLAVAKPSGAVLLNHYENEGVYQRYLGMHQWNVTERQGRLVIWNPQHSYDVGDLVGQWATVTTSRVPAEGGRERVLARVERRQP